MKIMFKSLDKKFRSIKLQLFICIIAKKKYKYLGITIFKDFDIIIANNINISIFSK